MNPVTGLSIGRIVIGSVAHVKPELVSGMITGRPDGALMTRWFGTREIALGAATLLTRGGAQRTLIAIGMAVDGADAVTAVGAVGSGEIPKRLGTPAAAVAGFAVVSGLLGLLGVRPRRRKSPAPAAS